MSEAGWDVDELLALGRWMDARPSALVEAAAELLKVRDREGVERPLLANAVQKAFERGRGRQNIVLKARQMGMTTWVAGRFFLKTITARGVMTVQVAQTREAAEGIFRIVQRFWECLPEELREGPLRRSKANAGQMCFPELDSEFRVVSAADENAGRGLTVQYLHCSEVSRWPGDAGATLAGLRAALAPEGEMVMESTPNGAYGCFYEEWGRAQQMGGLASQRDSGVVRHFFPWWMEDAYVGAAVDSLREDELRLVSANGLTARQIGFRRGLEASYRGLRSQEFAEDAESCFKATGECCFEVEAVEARLASVGEPLEVRRGGALQVWLPPIAGKEYVVAVDTAGGGADGDYAAVQVIERASGMQCAELQQRLGTLELARASAELAREYGGAMIAVERNNHGAGVLAYLDSVERYARVYEQGGVAGWLTTAGSKPGMVSRMGALLVESAWMFFSRRLLGECRTFVAMAGGRTGAVNGAHDDCLMAMAVAQAVRAEILGKR
ncbi:terminase [Granulicella sp. S190]|uniref:phage terminase large subunit family protein n=1 Tax=Granulicella sp. S190 TaxID=1747226 RepID=UPI0020B155A7|nr:terminase [Granulicella sp. S190]